MKLCKRCDTVKPPEQFGRNKSHTDGRHPTCLQCERERAAARKQSPEDMARWQREYARRHPEKIREKARNRRRVEPEKVRAREQLRQAVKDGKVERPLACDECGAERRVEAHHDDYSKPFEVAWLCRGCHCHRHGKELHVEA